MKHLTNQHAYEEHKASLANSRFLKEDNICAERYVKLHEYEGSELEPDGVMEMKERMKDCNNRCKMNL